MAGKPVPVQKGTTPQSSELQTHYTLNHKKYQVLFGSFGFKMQIHLMNTIFSRKINTFPKTLIFYIPKGVQNATT